MTCCHLGHSVAHLNGDGAAFVRRAGYRREFYGIGFEFLPRTASVPESATGQRRSHVIGRDGNVGGIPSSTAVEQGRAIHLRSTT